MIAGVRWQPAIWPRKAYHYFLRTIRKSPTFYFATTRQTWHDIIKSVESVKNCIYKTIFGFLQPGKLDNILCKEVHFAVSIT